MVKVERNKKEKNLISMWSLKAGDIFAVKNRFGEKYIYIKLDPAISRIICSGCLHMGLNLRLSSYKTFEKDEQVLYFPHAILNTNEEEYSGVGVKDIREGYILAKNTKHAERALKDNVAGLAMSCKIYLRDTKGIIITDVQKNIKY